MQQPSAHNATAVALEFQPFLQALSGRPRGKRLAFSIRLLKIALGKCLDFLDSCSHLAVGYA